MSDSTENRNSASEALPALLLEAFQAATGLGVRVVRADSETPLWACENRFCHLIRTSRLAGTPCQAMRGSADCRTAPTLIRRCPAGLEHVTVTMPGQTGPSCWVESGQVFLSPPQPRDFSALCRRFALDGACQSTGEIRRAFFSVPVLDRRRLEAVVTLLGHLIPKIAPLLYEDKNASLASADGRIAAGRRFVEQHLSEPIRLADLASVFERSRIIGPREPR